MAGSDPVASVFDVVRDDGGHDAARCAADGADVRRRLAEPSTAGAPLCSDDDLCPGIHRDLVRLQRDRRGGAMVIASILVALGRNGIHQRNLRWHRSLRRGPFPIHSA